MIDKFALSRELTDAFVSYQYRLDFPMPSPEETKLLHIKKYQNDIIFRAKVDSLVSGVMQIVSKHIDKDM
jgi:hypothetical protein